MSPEEVIALARREGVPSIAYTYNEPTVFAEYVVDIARLARRAGIQERRGHQRLHRDRRRGAEIYADLDAANVDLKGFSEEFYRREVKGALAAGPRHARVDRARDEDLARGDDPADPRV